MDFALLLAFHHLYQQQTVIMLRNYLKIALRNLRKQAGYSLINIGGLGLGLACCFLIVLFVQHELSFDGFHTRADRIYRLVPTTSAGEPQASTASGFAVDLQAAYPEIEAAVRVENFRTPYVQMEGQRRPIGDMALVDPAFFTVFDFPLVRGTPETVLADPHGLVLSETTARTLFGDADPMGRSLILFEDMAFTVTGVMEDVPPNSHLQFDFAGSFELMPRFMGENALRDYTNFNYSTYLLLKPGVAPEQLEAKFPTFIRQTIDEEADWSLNLQPLEAIHFTTNIRYDVNTNRDIRYVYAFSVIGLLILLIACINFMNLATAQAARRAKEVGVRKVVGAARPQLIAQFIGESVMLSILAIVLALGFVLFFLPTFNEIIGAEIAFGAEKWGTVVLLVGIGLLAGVVAGSYPALYLSAYEPAHVLKGEATRSKRAAYLRKGLIVTQFAISVFLMISTLTVYSQLRHMRGQDLGFDKEHVVFATFVQPLQENYEAFRQELLQNPRVLSVTRTGGLPGSVNTNRGYNWPGETADSEEQSKSFYTITADPGYLETLGLELIAGRNFSRERESDWQDTYILNEAAVQELGWDDPVGHPFRVWDRPMGEVIGVVKDFHFQSLHQEIGPVVINMKPWFGRVAVRIAQAEIPATLAYLEQQWRTFAPAYPFNYTFLDDDFDRLYRAEAQLMQRFTFFACIAIFIACLGLFGLAAYSAEQRTKEIGVRKVLGASAGGIVVLLSKDFTRLVLIAFCIAAPLAYYAMSRWLQNFAYRTAISWEIFLIAGFVALALAFLTVSYQSIKAARSNPVRALRYE